jgi:hypothetical protein
MNLINHSLNKKANSWINLIINFLERLFRSKKMKRNLNKLKKNFIQNKN